MEQKMQSDIHIFYTTIGAWREPALFEQGLSLLKKERQEKVMAQKCPDDRLRSLAAGLLLRYACIKKGLDYDSLLFSGKENGKPGVGGMEYNLSHSGDYAALAAGDVPVGIDVESLRNRFGGERGIKRLKRIVGRTFDDRETVTFVSRLDQDGALTAASLDFAAEVWTRKESFAKECGVGLGMDFSEIHTMDTEGFFTFALPGDYRLSIFCRKPVKIENLVCVPAAEMVR